MAELRGMNRAAASTEIDRWLQKMDLVEWENKKIEDLSKGMAQKIQFIATVLHKPELIILDEPFSGLDPINMTLLKDLMLELNTDGATIIFSTHIMEQAERLCEKICLINAGTIVLEGDLREIKKSCGRGSVEIEYSGNVDLIKNSRFVDRFNDFGQYVEVRLNAPEHYSALLRELIEASVDITRFELMEPTLHEIFVQSVQGEGGRSNTS